METNKIADTIIKSMTERGFIIFGTTIQGGGLDECDVLGINRNEYIFEYEIKRSRADFKADFKKTHKHFKLKNKHHSKTYDEWKNGKRTGGKVEHILIPNRSGCTLMRMLKLSHIFSPKLNPSDLSLPRESE